MKNLKTRIVKLGVVGVDSGQLVICDPTYIESEYQQPDSEGKEDHAHGIYRHTDGKLWQFCYGGKPSHENVNKFPGSYETVIEEYGLTPNQLVEGGDFKETDLDPTPHIPDGEFSYRGICKVRDNNNQGGQLNYLLGHPGVAVAFSSGMGDGEYGVYAELVETKDYGERVKKVWVEVLTDKEIMQMNQLTNLYQ